MHTHTLLYKILVEDVLGEARTPTVSDDFIREWPRVLKAINRTKQTGENSEVFISGRSHKYENYDSGGEVKIKVVTIPKDKEIRAVILCNPGRALADRKKLGR